MKILFRADGNKHIGWGHVMRSLSIASEAQNMGSECFFVCADTSLKAKIEEYGFNVRILNSDYSRMENELISLLEIINVEIPDYIIVDSYYVTNKYFGKLKEYSKVVYIDDELSFPYDVDYLINYNIYASEEKYKKLYSTNKMPELRLGMKYVPLRDEFKNIAIRDRNEVKNVFVSTGGSDEARLVLKIINGLIEKKELTQNINYHFIIGKYEPDKDEIRKIANQYKWIIPHENVMNMSEIMSMCDIAISAAGSTLYELCACGVPTITYIMADNQIKGAEEFAGLDLMLNAGDIRKNNLECENIILALNELINDKERRMNYSKRVKAVIDGNGAGNIINSIIYL